VQRSATTRYQIVNARSVAERIVRCSSTLVAPHLFVPFLFSCTANAARRSETRSVTRHNVTELRLSRWLSLTDRIREGSQCGRGSCCSASARAVRSQGSSPEALNEICAACSPLRQYMCGRTRSPRQDREAVAHLSLLLLQRPDLLPGISDYPIARVYANTPCSGTRLLFAVSELTTCEFMIVLASVSARL
jgi:hypothetical protein